MKSVIQNTTLVPDGTSLVIAAGATVEVRNTSGTLVNLWSDRDGTTGVASRNNGGDGQGYGAGGAGSGDQGSQGGRGAPGCILVEVLR